MSGYQLGLTQATLAGGTPQPVDVQHVYEQHQTLAGAQDIVNYRYTYTQVWIYPRLTYTKFRWLQNLYLSSSIASANSHTVWMRFHETKSDRWWIGQGVMLEPEPGTVRPWGIEKTKVTFSFIRLIQDDTGGTQSPFPELGPPSALFVAGRADVEAAATLPTKSATVSAFPINANVRAGGAYGLQTTVRRIAPPGAWIHSLSGIGASATVQPIVNQFAIRRRSCSGYPLRMKVDTKYMFWNWGNPWIADSLGFVNNGPNPSGEGWNGIFPLPNREYDGWASVRFLVPGTWTVWPSVWVRYPNDASFFPSDYAAADNLKLALVVGNPRRYYSGSTLGQPDLVLGQMPTGGLYRSLSSVAPTGGGRTYDFGFDKGDGSGTLPITFTIDSTTVGRWLGIWFNLSMGSYVYTYNFGLKFQAPDTGTVLAGPPTHDNGYDTRLELRAERMYWANDALPAVSSNTIGVLSALGARSPAVSTNRDYGDPAWEGTRSHLSGYGATDATRFGYTATFYRPNDSGIMPTNFYSFPWATAPYTTASVYQRRPFWLTYGYSLGVNPWFDASTSQDRWTPNTSPDSTYLLRFAPFAWEWRCTLREWPAKRIAEGNRYDYYFAIGIYDADTSSFMAVGPDTWPNRVYQGPPALLSTDSGNVYRVLSNGVNFRTMVGSPVYYFEQATWLGGGNETYVVGETPSSILRGDAPLFDNLWGRWILPAPSAQDRRRWKFCLFSPGPHGYPTNFRWRGFVGPSQPGTTNTYPIAVTLSLFVVDRNLFPSRVPSSIAEFWLEAPMTPVSRGTV